MESQVDRLILRAYWAFVVACMVFVSGMLWCAVPVNADAVRVFTASNTPRRKLAKQFSAGANVFATADPSPAGTPLTITSATGIAGSDGSVVLTFLAGFTAPITITVYYWNQDLVNTSNSCWVRLGNEAAAYSATIDSNYVSVPFALPVNAPFLVRTSAAVTGDVYTDARAHSSNNNTATGY